MTRATVGFSLVCLLSATLTTAQEGFEPPKPGPEHEILKQNEGTWIAATKMPDGTESKGESTSKMECGGLWLVTNFEGDFGGMKFQGKGLDSYDPAKKKYVAVWVDSMTTAPMFLEGTYDEKAKTLTMTGEGPGPDGKPTKYKMVTKYKDKDHHDFQMFMGDVETPMMTIAYTRKK
jgi:hypothetical protein